jgi:hypothetical protein
MSSVSAQMPRLKLARCGTILVMKKVSAMVASS